MTSCVRYWRSVMRMLVKLPPKTTKTASMHVVINMVSVDHDIAVRVFTDKAICRLFYADCAETSQAGRNEDQVHSEKSILRAYSCIRISSHAQRNDDQFN